MPGPKPPIPNAAEALAAINTQDVVDMSAAATKPMADFAAQNLANEMQRAQAQALAGAAAPLLGAIDPASPENRPPKR